MCKQVFGRTVHYIRSYIQRPCHHVNTLTLAAKIEIRRHTERQPQKHREYPGYRIVLTFLTYPAIKKISYIVRLNKIIHFIAYNRYRLPVDATITNS